MFVERDWQQMWGRWFTGAYDEKGLDITLRRAGNDPIVLGVLPEGRQGLNPGTGSTDLRDQTSRPRYRPLILTSAKASRSPE